MASEAAGHDERTQGPWGPLGQHCHMAWMDTVGGCRGLVASHDLKAGTLILAEEPVMHAPEVAGAADPNLHAALARKILSEPNGSYQQEVLEKAKHLHPVALTDLPADVLEAQKIRLSETVKSLAAEPNSSLNEEEVLRLLLAIQCNAFYSGLYLNLALINHSCRPNCTKLTPWSRVQTAEGRRKSGTASEIWAVRDIKEGEEITISYLQPLEQSHPRREKEFLQQHLWHLAASPHPTELDAVHDESCLSTIERIEDQLEELDSSSQLRAVDRMETLRGLREELQGVCGPRHLALARAHAMLVRCALELLGNQEDPSTELAIDLVSWAVELLCTQEILYGMEHPEVGGTCADIADALDFLLGTSPKALFKAFPSWADFPRASKAGRLHVGNTS